MISINKLKQYLPALRPQQLVEAAAVFIPNSGIYVYQGSHLAGQKKDPLHMFCPVDGYTLPGAETIKKLQSSFQEDPVYPVPTQKQIKEIFRRLRAQSRLPISKNNLICLERADPCQLTSLIAHTGQPDGENTTAKQLLACIIAHHFETGPHISEKYIDLVLTTKRWPQILPLCPRGADQLEFLADKSPLPNGGLPPDCAAMVQKIPAEANRFKKPLLILPKLPSQKLGLSKGATVNDIFNQEASLSRSDQLHMVLWAIRQESRMIPKESRDLAFMAFDCLTLRQFLIFSSLSLRYPADREKQENLAEFFELSPERVSGIFNVAGGIVRKRAIKEGISLIPLIWHGPKHFELVA